MRYKHFAPFSTFMALIALAALVYMATCEKRACAGSSDCETLHDADDRNYCRGISKGDITYCELIKDHDKRAMCRALVRK